MRWLRPRRRSLASSAGGGGVENVHVVRNGADLSVVEEAPPHPDEEQRELRCVYMGNVGRSQGLDMVVRAAAELQRRGVAISVRIMGHGAHVRELAELAASLQAPVRVSTRIEHSLVRLQYEWADSVIVSLRDWGPFEWTIPSKLYEVLATGRHITGVLSGEAAALVRDNAAGDVVPPGDLEALVQLWERLAADRGLCRQPSRGREWVARHADDPGLIARYLEILEDVRRTRDAPERAHTH